MAENAQNSPFIRNLASSDKRTRDQALESLRAFLSSRTDISDMEMLKLWKGLFYCLWMQDKPAQQQALSRSLADIPSILRPTVVIPFLRAFWVTMAREWAQIEALRLDKYLYLIRQYVSASFRYLSRNDWGDTKAIEEYSMVMAEVPMNLGEGDGSRIPNGLRFHVLDVWVDELEKVDCEWGKEKKQVLEMLCAPVERLTTEGRLKVVRTAAMECLADERLRRWRGHGKEKVSDDAKEDKEEEWVEELDG